MAFNFHPLAPVAARSYAARMAQIHSGRLPNLPYNYGRQNYNMPHVSTPLVPQYNPQYQYNPQSNAEVSSMNSSVSNPIYLGLNGGGNKPPTHGGGRKPPVYGGGGGGGNGNGNGNGGSKKSNVVMVYGHGDNLASDPNLSSVWYSLPEAWRNDMNYWYPGYARAYVEAYKAGDMAKAEEIKNKAYDIRKQMSDAKANAENNKKTGSRGPFDNKMNYGGTLYV
jgi:hypothetical protein